MLKEMGLGLVLMFGGDGDAARAAGAALLADKANDAIEEGGFSAVEYGDWQKGFDGRRFWLAFDGVSVTKSDASLTADYAVIFPFSVELRFERGVVKTGELGDTVRFTGVDVTGNLSPFRSSLDVVGYGVAPDLDVGQGSSEFCLFGTECSFPTVLDDQPFERFSIHLDRVGRKGHVVFEWRKAGECSRIELQELPVERGVPLAVIGRSLVEDTLDGPVEVYSGPCLKPDNKGRSEAMWLADATLRDAQWSERERAIDSLLRLLLVSVPESYQYLVE